MKVLKRFSILIITLLVILFVIGWMAHESLPKGGKEGEEADKMALKMENALEKGHWHDIQYIQWSFKGVHHFLWDKHRNMVRVKWEDYTIYTQPGTVKGIAFKGMDRLEEESAEELIKKANDYFNNDMFWLVAPFKSFDDGVKREVVSYDGENRLLVTYGSGGSTPGDSYLWKLEEDGTPESYKMWTQIIPIGGVEATWEDYHTLGNGIKISHFHKLAGLMDLCISNVKAGYSFEEMNCEKDPFKVIIEE